MTPAPAPAPAPKQVRLAAAVALAAFGLAAPLPAAAEEVWEPGEKLTFMNCGRCHVIGERNRMGGISSTPSFMVIRGWENWEDRMKAFWTLNPHPAFTQIEGVTEPFPPDRPSPIHPIRLTLDQVEEIMGYARSVPPADLGDGIEIR